MSVSDKISSFPINLETLRIKKKDNKLIEKSMQEVWSYNQRKECTTILLSCSILILFIQVLSDSTISALVNLNDLESLFLNSINLKNPTRKLR